ncbi:hypothetical protein HJC23_008481 [Cyclotella cryptica]|uniref:Uncharacterized protein n=1 Tax=Cyclotella cryptica TaxID=29204 RepID=A0ABD3QYL2_9STRA|eukprot:CCRYP_001222-RA/>CCRYP_001222-RA protein AED:0.52 eAED:0.34 QI:0/-1/0/1/-1/1/1/0/339
MRIRYIIPTALSVIYAIEGLVLVTATPISAVATPSDGVSTSSPQPDDLSFEERPMSVANEDSESSPATDGNDHGSSKKDDYTNVAEGTIHENVKPQQSKSQRTAPPPRNERNSNHDDEQTYLDLFGERAKELLTQHIIPSTDTKCRWDWRMGRCEPYCECGYYFLWGDYHVGRSCRLRSKFTPLYDSNNEAKTSSASLQDAWQQWAERMDDPDAFSSFVDSARKSPVEVEKCNLPPESRYTQAVYYLTKLLGHGTIVLRQFQKVKHRAADAVTHGNHRFTNLRENACTGLKRIIEERERGRNQPVVLTRRGNMWIRRLCVTGNDTVFDDTIDNEQITIG